jgi:hypothetical protein
MKYEEKGWIRGIRPEMGFIIFPRLEPQASVFIDAVQLEENDKATEYAPR